MHHIYESHYKNVQLRQLQDVDLEFLRQWRNNPDNTKFLRKIPYITEKKQQKWYQRYLADEGEMIFAIVENEQLKRIVGSLSLYNFENDRAEFGKILIGDEEAHGKKVGTNALIAVLMLAFDKFKLQEVYLHVFADNLAAIKSYEKAGLHIVEQHKVANNLEYIMSINKNDFNSAKREVYGAKN